eukprot:5270539-Amphidinium_carterae.1
MLQVTCWNVQLFEQSSKCISTSSNFECLDTQRMASNYKQQTCHFENEKAIMHNSPQRLKGCEEASMVAKGLLIVYHQSDKHGQ